MIVEADKSLSASQENQWCSSNPIAGILETQVDLMFQLSSKGRKTPLCPSLKAGRQQEFPLYEGESAILPYLSFQLIGWCIFKLGEVVICFAQTIIVIIVNVKLIQKHPRRNTRVLSDQISEYLVTQSGWHIKLTVTITILNLSKFI